ncbi:hypothetical protein HK099_008058 [Clydaea vesicula]|uniref:Large ribosomal subunit protein mL49 n=1 Tax=Clydaea vesicula TaxID=447962 RepID=A0AAD5TW64_9FUNG|nr:hypothetical protein HK099_008058 [Clydaea vesicula]KAJ3394956.1 hypothetical protein HDU92_006421 [Lobulomyces angularis]
MNNFLFQGKCLAQLKTQVRFKSVIGKVAKPRVVNPPLLTKDLKKIVDLAKAQYVVHRTAKGGWLPIYSEYKHGRTQLTTIIRRIEGNTEALVKDIATIIPGERIKVKENTNHVVIKGNYVEVLRDWFTVQGF